MLNELEKIYEIYIACQNGEKEKLNQIFKIDDHGDVGFKFDCFLKIKNVIKLHYDNEGMNYKQRHKKYYSGNYDLTDLDEMLFLLITEVYFAKKGKTGCIEVNGIVSSISIVDGETLLKNICFFLEKQLNLQAKISYLDTLQRIGFCDEDSADLFSTEDIADLETQYTHDKNKKPVEWWLKDWRIRYDILRFFQKDINALKDLFNTDSMDVMAVINTILDREDTFICGNYANEMCMITQTQLCKIIEIHTGIKICQSNLSRCIDTINHRILDHLLIFRDVPYIKMFGSNHMKIYALCDDQCNSWKDFIFNILKYDDALECLKGQIRYDFINLINCQNDVLSQSPEAIATKVSNVIKDYFNELENKKIRELFTEQKFENKFSNNDMGYWNIRIIGDEMKIKFYRNLYIKHPIEVCLERSNVAIYEGFSKIYIKDEKNNIVYFLPKANRKIFKNNCEKVA